jgi:hypothetical protein
LKTIFGSGLILILILSSNGLYAYSLDSLQDEHLIMGVPYVCQETDFYCAYACPTMIFCYYGINTSLSEVVFNSGVGYALLYSPPYIERSPVGCIVSCKGENDRRFLGELYGLSYTQWQADLTTAEPQRWETYWAKAKENISKDVPVITNLDPMNLPSLRNAIRKELGIHSTLWIKISNILWDISPSYMYHAIVLVGYNEANQTVCYQDPSAGLYGHAEVGTYAWMDLSTLRKALHRLNTDTPYFSYVVETFADTPVAPLDKEQVFLKAHERNLQKMKGDHSVYDSMITEQWNVSHLGILGVQQMNTDFSKGIANRITTIAYYKYYCFIRLLTADYRLSSLLSLMVPDSVNFSLTPNFFNKFTQIAMEKTTIVEYLNSTKSSWSNPELSQLCAHDAQLLLYEQQNWSRLADHFEIFIKRGLLISTPRAVLVVKDMVPSAQNIFLLEQEISESV